MIKINLKRSSTHCKLSLLLLSFLGSLQVINSAPVNPESSKESTSFPSQKKSSLDQDIESPGDYEWNKWLGEKIHLSPNPPHSPRVIAKSVFIAPQLELEPCADGYKADSMGRCQKIVNIDQDAYDNFVLQQLHKLLGKGSSSDSSSSKEKQPVASGPLQVNIPLLLDTNKDTDSQMEEDDGRLEDDGTSEDRFEDDRRSEDDKRLEEDRRLENDKRLEDDRRSEEDKRLENDKRLQDDRKSEDGILEDESRLKDDERIKDGRLGDDERLEDDEAPLEAIPLETNQEEFIDYNVRNGTSEEFLDSNFTVQKNSKESSSPVFVIPVAHFNDEAKETFPGVVDYKIPFFDNRTDNEKGKKQEDSLEESTTKDEFLIDEYLTTIRDSIEESTTRETRIENLTDSPIRIDIETWSQKKNKNTSGNRDENVSLIESNRKNLEDKKGEIEAKKNVTIETEDVYEEEFEPEDQEYLDTTQIAEEEIEDEILKHGESGMMIPLEKQALIRSENKKKKKLETTTFSEIESESMATTERGEDLESNVSSEVSIDKDFIVETTLLDVNRGKVKNSTEPVSANSTASEQKRDDDLKAEKKPEVVFSPQDNHGVYDRKRDGQLLTTNFQSIKESHNLTTTEPPVVSKPARLHFPLETQEEEQEGNFHSKRILPLSIENKLPLQSANLDLKDFGSFRRDFVKFPNDRNRQGYVRFPSDEVNSIHSPEIKDRFSYSEYPAASGNNKNTFSFNQNNKSGVMFSQNMKNGGLLSQKTKNGGLSNQNTKSGALLNNKSGVTFNQNPKSGVSFNQKQPNWRIPHPPRVDHQAFMQAQTSSSNQNLLRFWERMPLLTDPSLNPRYPTNPLEKEAISRSSRISSSRRINFYKAKSPQVKRVLSQNMRAPIGG